MKCNFNATSESPLLQWLERVMLCEEQMFSFKCLTTEGKILTGRGSDGCFESINFCFCTQTLKLNAIISCNYHEIYTKRHNTLTDKEIYKHKQPPIQLQAV